MVDLTLGFGDLIAILALGISIYALRNTSKLNVLLLQKEVHIIKSAKKANLNGSLDNIGGHDYRFTVWNDGESKFPLEVLEPNGRIELIASVHMETPRKQPIHITWTDEHSDKNEKIVYATI